MQCKALVLIAAATFAAGGAMAQQTSTTDSPSADASGPKAGAPDKSPGGNATSMKHHKAMKSSNKGAKPTVDDASAQSNSKKSTK